VGGHVASQEVVGSRRGAFRRRFRIYAAPPGQPRTRRATDVLLLLGALAGLILLTSAYPPSGFENSFESFLDNMPGWLDPLWGFLYDLLWLWAMLLLLGAVVCRRYVVALHAVGAFVLAAVIGWICSRWAIGHWPSVGAAVEGASDSPDFPAMRVAETAAVILVVAPHLVRSLRTTGRWILFLGVAGGILADTATPGGNLAAFLAAVTAAAAVRLAFGTSAGRPGVKDVASSLVELGIECEGLQAAERQVAGVVVFTGRDPDGHELLIRVYGQDAYDNQLLAKLWRTLWYRDGGPQLGLSRLQAVEHEALMTLLAVRAGVPTREVVTAGQTADGDALLVLRGAARPLAEVSADELDDELLQSAWRMLDRLGRAGIAHLQIDPSTVAIAEGDVWLLDFGVATAAPTNDQLQTDRVQLLAATAAVAGGERAVGSALEALGTDGAAALLPYLQSAALATPLRKTVRAAGIDMDQLRADVATATGGPVPDLIKLRRLTWWTVVQAALLVLAFAALLNAFGDVDWSDVRTDLSNADWAWIVFGFFLSQVPRLTQAVAMLGSIAARLPFGPVYIKELATCYLNLAMPSSIARMAMSIRFFQCQGLPGAAAVTAGAIDSLANNVVQLIIVALLLIFGESTLDIGLSAPSSDSGSGHLLWILLGLLVVTVLVVVLVGRIRRALVERVRKWWPEVRDAITGLRGAGKLRLLILGNVATELLFSAALGVFARALGYHIPFGEVLLINESVALLSSFIPVPGGIGVVEFGLSVGLTSAGMTQESALVTVLLYRLSTFYLPPIWGFFAVRWLQRNRYL
jgi:glycosyltransferase 2 family protein